jgi:hypothetical protein
VFADNTNVAHQIAKDLPSATVLDGRFNVVQMSIAVPKQNTAAITIVDEFVRDAKRDGRPGGREALRALNRVCKGRVRGELEAVEGVGEDGRGAVGSSAFIRDRKSRSPDPPFKAIEASWEVESLFAPEGRRQHASRFVHPQIGSEFEKPFV